MNAQMRAHLMPEAQLKHEAYSTDSQKYEGVKAKIDGQLLLVESCFGKCGANFLTGNGLGANGDACLTKCFTKFFDASLVCHKEMNLYSIGTRDT